jgi:KipI family sensor histidine kinase inhibitor
MRRAASADPVSAAIYPRFLDAGETALVVEFGDSVDPAINARVLALDAALRANPAAGLRECVPTYRSLMIHYDPLQVDRDTLIGIARDASLLASAPSAKPATWILPCCYEPPYSEDINEAALLLKLGRDEVVALHTTATLRVYMYGFAPGQLYLGGLPDALAISRRAEPRPPHPAGSVLIGGGLGVVAPFVMPTGWYVLGCTPERLYAPERANPFFIQPGDNLRFEPVGVADFRSLQQRASRGEIVARRELR